MLVKLKYLSQILNYSSSSSSIVLKESNILITKDGTVGKVFLLTSENLEFLKSRYSSYLVLKPSSFCPPSYLYYYLLSPHFSSWYSEIKKSFATINHLNISDLKEFPIIFSSLPIQQQELISFLDQKCSLIQQLFQKIDLLLKRLEDYQASIIYEKIYQKSYPRKKANSYISILGGVPCSYDPKGFIPVYGSGGIFQKTNQILYSGESVLVGRKGTLNKPFYLSSSSQFWIVDTVYCIQNKNPLFLNLKYFYYFYCSLNFKEFQSGSVLPSMTQSSILSLLLPLPSLIQQNAIVSELDSKICLLSQLQHYYQSLRSHLEEYQESLLYETFQHLLKYLKSSLFLIFFFIPINYSFSKILSFF